MNATDGDRARWTGPRLAGWVDRQTNRQLFVTMLLGCLVVFATTAHWYGVNNADTIAAAWPAWTFAHSGTFFLESSTGVPANPWFAESGAHLVSNRMPGVILIGVPAQLLFLGADVYPVVPAVVTAVVVTSFAMANLLLLLLRAGIDSRLAMAGTSAVALGTGIWTNASAELWTHGPDMLWLSLAMLFLQQHRHWLAGLSFAPAILTRPHLAVLVAVAGFVLATNLRSAKVLFALGIPAGAGAAGVMAWNEWMFGTIAGGGGYAGSFAAATDAAPSAWSSAGLSLLGMLVSPLHGLLVHSPFVLIGAVAIAFSIRSLPAWCRGCLLGVIAYQLVQANVNGFTGGTGFYSYRLALELVFVATLPAMLGYAQWRRRAPMVRPAARLLIGLSVAIHLIGVYWYQPFGRLGQELDPWTNWGVWVALQSRSSAAMVVAAAAALLVIALAFVRLPREVRRADPGASPGQALPRRVPVSA